ncbi:MAG: histidine kinase, partial [Myxococcales bacterium]|nr:histidine kinase [Myxococcales bacterium]
MSVALPLVVALVYLVGLGLLSELADRRPALANLARHPVVYALALGVYATSWTFYGSVGFAARYGYAFLAVSLGVVLACLAIPVLWRPVAELVRRHRFTSLADLFAFRYQSELAGALVTLLLVAGLLPYLALQLRAVADAAVFLAGDDAPPELGLVYVALLGLFAV